MERWLAAVFGLPRVHWEDPIIVAAEDNERNEPEPDVAVLRAPLEELKRKPLPESALLIIEVAATTPTIDLTTHAYLYTPAPAFRLTGFWTLTSPE